MRILPTILLSLSAAARLGAQSNGLSTISIPWSLAIASGPVGFARGGPANLVSPNGGEILLGLRARLPAKRWWLGVEVSSWSARANAAGVDILAARGGATYKENGAEFETIAFAASVRYDAWLHGPVTGYGLASLGTNESGGTIYGDKCHPLYCEIPRVDVDRKENDVVGSIGLGAQVQFFKFKGWWRLLPGSVYVEVRARNEGTPDGRITRIPLQFGISF